MHKGYRIRIVSTMLLLGSSFSTLASEQDAASPAPAVRILVGPQPHELEAHAAQELAHYLDRLFHIDSSPSTASKSDPIALLLLGNPETNPAVATALGPEGWPDASDQGIVLKRTSVNGTPALVVGGGSPVATLWAVYELAEFWGVRYLQSGDVFPETPPVFSLPATDKFMEPTFRSRWYKTMGDFAMGMEGWGLADYRPFIDQLAKMKFNRIRVGSSPSQPFLNLRFGGIAQETAVLWYGEHFPITSDMPGRARFGDAPEFWNPDLPLPPATGAEMLAAGERHCRALIAYARTRGIDASFVGSVTDFPREFSSLVPEAQGVSQLGALTVGPGASVRPDNEALLALAGSVIRSTVGTYPEAASYGFPVGTEWNGWVDAYDWAWRELDRQYKISEAASLEEVLHVAGGRPSHDGPERATRQVKGALAGLYFLSRLWADPGVLPETVKPDARLVVYEPPEELFPILPRLLPDDAELLIVIDYNPSRVLSRRDVLATVPARDVATTLVLTLHDDSVGLLPMLTTSALHELVSDMRKYGISGFCTRQWLMSDHDPSMAYLSKAAWDPTATPTGVIADQVRAVCGEAAVEPMLEFFRALEAVTTGLEDHGMGLTFPYPGMLTQFWTHEPPTRTLPEDRVGYQRARALLERIPNASRPEGREYVRYWQGRIDFALGYLDTIEAVKEAAMAEKAALDEQAAGDPQAHRTHLADALTRAESAQALVTSAIEAYAAVARNRADLGAIATLGEYAYRPLRAKIDELRRQQESLGS